MFSRSMVLWVDEMIKPKTPCPECHKKTIVVHNYTNGDKLFIHERKKTLIGYDIKGCYIKGVKND